jgi:3-oxoacyl-[acyl-carrier-protein] synthase II
MRKVVVTGAGLVTPLGVGVEESWRALLARKSGAGPITSFDASDLPVRIACEVPDFEPGDFLPAKEVSRTDRFTQMGVAAASMAWDSAALDGKVEQARAGVIVGSGIGGLTTILDEHSAFLRGGARRVSPFTIPKLMPNAAAAAIAMKLRLSGTNYAPASACATGAHAIGEAFHTIRQGRADAMLAGGSEAGIVPLAMAAFARMGALSRRNDDPEKACRPFDSKRDGFVMGEGAGVLVLEEATFAQRRGAPVLAEMVGYGASADAFHVTQPDPEGYGAALAMREALQDAGAAPESVDHINAHGTSTPYNDRIESVAIKSVFGVEAKRIPVSSTKSQTGHLLGAAGAVEAIFTFLALRDSVVPATINLDEPDPECDLDYVADGPRELTMRLALCNSFGFGGQNACLAFASADGA